jgi:hypothetical protein
VVRHSAYHIAKQGVYIRLIDHESSADSSLIYEFVKTVQWPKDYQEEDEQEEDEPPSLIADSDDELSSADGYIFRAIAA